MIVLDFLVKSNIWVAINCTALYFYISKILNKEIDLYYGLLVFTATILVYSGQRYIRIFLGERLSSYVAFYQQHHLLLKTTWFISIVYIAFQLISLSARQIGILAISLALCILYVYNPFGRPLRNKFSQWKPFIIGFIWTIVLLGVPFPSSGPFIYLAVFLLISGYTIPFDLRDEEHDLSNGFITIAHIHKRSYIITLSFLMIITSFVTLAHISFANNFSLLVAVCFLSYLLFRISKNNLDSDFNIGLESLPMVLLFSQLCLSALY